MHWELQEKDADAVAEAVTLGLEDASVRGREIARLAYLNLHQSFPRKTDKLKAGLSSASLRARLTQQEEQHMRAVKQQQQAAAAAAAVATPASAAAPASAAPASAAPTAPAAAAVAAIEPAPAAPTVPSGSPAIVRGVVVAVVAPGPLSSTDEADADLPPASFPNSNLALALTVPESASTPIRVVATPGKISLRVRRQSCQDEAVTSIQAVVRGALTRRMSLTLGAITPGGLPRTPRLSSISSPPAVAEEAEADSRQGASPAPTPSPVKPTPKPTPSTAASTPPRPSPSPSRKPSPSPRSGTRASTNNNSSSSGSGSSPLRTSIENELRPGPVPRSPSKAVASGIISAASPSRREAVTLVPSSEALAGARVGDEAKDNKATMAITVGAGVTFLRQEGDAAPSRGVVRFVGLTSFAPGTWVGIEPLAAPAAAADSNNNSNNNSNNDKENSSPSASPARRKTASAAAAAAEDGVFIRAEQVLSVFSAPPLPPAPLVSVSTAQQTTNEQGPGTPSKAGHWIPSSASPSSRPRPAGGSPFGQLAKHDARRRGVVAGLVKVKAAQLTTLLARQLELLERLESGGAQADFDEVVSELAAVSGQETQLITNFKDRVTAILR